MDIQKPKYGALVKVAVLCIIVIQYVGTTVSTPLLGTLTQMFPDHPIMVKQISTIPSLAAIIPSLLIGPLNKYITKKNMLLIGTALACAQAIPGIIPGFGVLYVCCCITGLGIGFAYSFAASFIVDMFEGREQNNMMGMRSFVGAVAGILLMQVSGALCTKTGDYQQSYLVSLILIPIFLIVLFFMPKTNPIEEANRAAMRAPKEKSSSEPKEKNYTSLTWAFIVMTVVNICFAYTFMSTAPIVTASPVEAGGLGGSASTAANVMSCFSAAMAVSGVIFGPFWTRVFKNYTTAVGIILCTIGMGVAIIAPNTTVMIIAGIIYGFGFQVYNGAICLLLPLTSRPAAATAIIGVFFAFQNAGSFLATLITPNISRVLFPGALKGDWYVSIVGLAACSIIYLILCKKADKRAKALGYSK